MSRIILRVPNLARRALTLAALALALSAVVLVMGLSIDGDADEGRPRPAAEVPDAAAGASEDGGARRARVLRLDPLRRVGPPLDVRPPRARARSAAAGSLSCGDDLFVNPVTSCRFAEEVRRAYQAQGEVGTARVLSPTTGRAYAMRCTSTSPHVCVGGDGAALSFP